MTKIKNKAENRVEWNKVVLQTPLIVFLCLLPNNIVATNDTTLSTGTTSTTDAPATNISAPTLTTESVSAATTSYTSLSTTTEGSAQQVVITPEPVTEFYINNITENSFNVQWANKDNISYPQMRIVVEPHSTTLNFSVKCSSYGNGSCTFENGSNSITVTGLESGTLYNVKIYNVVNETLNSSATETTTYTIPKPVTDVQINNVRENSFNVSWTNAESRAYSHSKIAVEPNTGNLNFSVTCSSNESGSCTFVNDSTSVTVTGLESGTLYNVKIYNVVNGTLNSSAAERSSYTVPKPVTDVQINNVTENSFNVSWTNAESRAYSHSKIAVEPSTANLNFSVTCSSSESSSCTFVNGSTSVTVTGLKSGTLYNVKIYNDVNGTLNSSAAERSSYTVPKPVSDVQISNATENSFNVSWTNAESRAYSHSKIVVEPNTGNLNFSVTCSSNESGSCTFVNDSTSVTVTGLESGTLYNVKIYNVVNGTLNSSAVERSTYTVPKPVTDVQINNVTEISFNVSWTNAESRAYSHSKIAVEPNTGNLNFSVTCSSNESGSCTFVNGSTSVTVTGLESGTLYNVKIYNVVNGTLNSSAAERSTYTVPKPVTYVQINNVRENSFDVSWTNPESRAYSHSKIAVEPNTGNLNFSVTCSSNESSSCTFVNGSTSVTVTGLESGTLYNVKIYNVVNGTLNSSAAERLTYTVPKPVTDVQINNVRENSFDVSWTNAESRAYSHSKIAVEPNTGNLNFSVTCSSNESSSCTFVNGSTSVTVTGLESGTLYNVKIYKVVNGTLNSSAAERSSYTVPKPVSDVQISNATENSFNVSWTNAESRAYSYSKIAVEPNTGNFNFSVTCSSNESGSCTFVNDSTSVTVTGLESGTLYNVKIYNVVNGTLNSSAAERSLYTVPKPVTDVQINDVRENSFNVSWTNAESRYYSHSKIAVEPNTGNLNFSVTCSSNDNGSCTFVKGSTSVTVTELESGTLYNVKIYNVVNGTLNSSAAERSSYTVPKPVSDVQINNVRENSFNVSWTNAESRAYSHSKIAVEPNTGNLNFSVTCSSNDSGSCTFVNDSTSVTVTGLESGTLYNVKIYNVVNRTLNSSAAERSSYTVPKPVSDVQINNVRENSFNVSWTNAESRAYSHSKIAVEPNTGNFNFSVTCSSNDGGSCTFVNDSTSVTVTGLESGTLYNVKIYNVVNGTLKSSAAERSTYTVPKPVTDVQINNVTENNFNVSWTHAESRAYSHSKIAVEPNTGNFNFSVTCSSNDSGSCTFVNDSTSVTVMGLESGTLYNVKIYNVVNGTLNSIAAERSTYTVPKPVSDVQINNVRENSFNVSWTNAESRAYSHSKIAVEPNTGNLNFSVTCSSKDSGSCTFVNGSTSVTVMGLESGTLYNVKIYNVVNGTLNSSAVERSTYTIPETVTDVHIKNVTEDSFNVSWTNTENRSYSHLNIVIDPHSTKMNFSVTCTSDDSGSCTFANDSTSVTVTGLESGTLYNVKIYNVVNGTLNSSATERSTYTIPKPVTEVTINNVTEDSFNVQWTNKGNRSYSHLNIVIDPHSTKMRFSVTCSSNDSGSCTFVNGSTSVTVTGLERGTLYNVTIYNAVNGTLNSRATATSTFTKQVYNDSCTPVILEPPCSTRNSSCLEGRCLCDDDWFYLKREDQCVPKIDVNISQSSFNVTQTETHAIQLEWTIPEELPIYYVVVEVRLMEILRTPRNSSHLRIDSLQPGTNYSLKCYAEDEDFVPSAQFVTKFAVTYPVPLPTPGTIDNISQTSLTLRWIDNSSLQYTHLRIVVSPVEPSLKMSINCTLVEGNCTVERSQNETSMEIHGLDPGKFYTVVMYTLVADLLSDPGPNVTTFTRPPPPLNCSVISVTSTGLTIIWVNHNETRYTSLSIISSPQDGCANGNCTFNPNRNQTSYDVYGLKAGTMYKISIYTIIGGLLTDSPVYLNATTRPKLGVIANISNVTENSFELHWSGNESVNFTHISIEVKPAPLNLSDLCTEYNATAGKCIVTRNSTIVNFTGLVSGAFYTVIIHSMNNGLLSDGNIMINTYTRPPPPLNCSVNSVTSTGLTVNWINYHDILFTNLTIKISPQYGCNNGTCAVELHPNQTSYAIEGLKAGTVYNISIYTVIGGLLTNSPVQLIVATRPGKAKNVSIVNTSANSIEVKWDNPDDGAVDGFLVEFRCESPNKNSSMVKNQKYDIVHSQLMSTASNLDPGTLCKVYITAKFWNQTGETVGFYLNQTSNETAPEDVKFSRNQTSARSFNITWIKPDKPNGIIRQYRIKVIDTYRQCLMEEHVLRNCTDCDGHISCQGEDMEYMAPCDDNNTRTNGTFDENSVQSFTTKSGMHPYRNYTVAVQAYTRCWGSLANATLLTDEDVPAAAPIATILNITADTTKVEWTPLNESDRNGIITEYTIRLEYINHSCYSTNDGSVQSEEVSVNSTKYRIDLKNLRPFWIYNFTISASTSKGKGVFSKCTSKTCNVRTQESAPGGIESDSVKTEPTSTSVNLTWNVPCRPNGIITHYTYRIINLDEPVDTMQNHTTTNNTDYIIRYLQPYRNYSISVAANTAKGPGNFTNETNVTTSITKPYKPNSPKAKALTSTSLEITWQALPQISYTGPTYYEVKAIDTKDDSSIWNCSSLGYNSTKCIIDGLDEYWNYRFEVTAYTNAGNATSNISTGRTQEAKPGKVQSLILSPMTNITQPRSIVVDWTPPKERDLNGIITNYYLTFTNQNYSSQDIINIKSDAENHYVYDKIKPGFYNVSIYAATAAGNGSYEINTTTVQPGAPIPPPTDPGHPLITSGGNVNDDTKQISVQLALKRWLCNTTNGEPIEWGVVVAHKDQAIGSPFIGSTTGFSARKKDIYKKWSDIKNLESVPPYIATPRNWSPCRKGQRRKRSTEIPETQRFVVGESGQCSGTSSQEYCNGELQPGTTYRVKTFVCTAGGCSESEYSEPISTAPDLTVPVAAGVSSAVIVLVGIVVVVVLLKLRQKACFSKEVDDNKTTHVHGNDMLLDKIERTKPNAFKPGAVKLSEFPAYVEKMHKDSDLLFADAYRLLRENSPKHPTTAAEQQSCRPKNRYTDILPFDHSRVKILPVDDIEGSDYINANYIPGYTSPREYIAAQGPMQAVFDDFWRMVWEQNVDTIVMLTKLVEKGRRKCDQYWPELSEPQFYGDLVVNVQSESNMSDYVIRIFEVKLKDTKKIVRHFSYLKWPDMGCPETPELLLEFVKAVRQYTSRHNTVKTHGPTLVHCSAGVGRTGTFIAVDILLQHIRDHDEVDIYNLVLDMRNHRLRMIQTEDQYVYVHECVKAFITTDEEEEEEEQDHLYMNYPGAEYEEEENAYENTAFSTNMDKLTML